MWSGTRENRYEVTGPLPPCQRPGPDNDGGVTSRHRRERLSVSLTIVYYNFRREDPDDAREHSSLLSREIGVLDQEDV